MARKLDNSCCLFGVKGLLKRTDVLRQEVAALRKDRDGDPEHVHKTRVASRRLRVALELFGPCMPANLVDAWNKQIRRVTRKLRDPRDIDVQIDFLEQALGAIKNKRHRGGIKRLELRLRQHRQELQEQVDKTVARLNERHVLAEMGQSLRKLRADFGKGEGDNSPVLYELAGRTIKGRLKDMLAYEPCVHQPKQVEQLHAMRIAAKGLRYAMEVFEPLYGEQFKQPLKEMRKAQTLLGDVHDFDTWLSFLPQFLQQEKARTIIYFGQAKPLAEVRPGIQRLTKYCRQHRDKCFKEFQNFWDQLTKDNAWPALRQILGSQPKNAAKSSRQGGRGKPSLHPASA